MVARMSACTPSRNGFLLSAPDVSCTYPTQERTQPWAGLVLPDGFQAAEVPPPTPTAKWLKATPPRKEYTTNDQQQLKHPMNTTAAFGRLCRTRQPSRPKVVPNDASNNNLNIKTVFKTFKNVLKLLQQIRVTFPKQKKKTLFECVVFCFVLCFEFVLFVLFCFGKISPHIPHPVYLLSGQGNDIHPLYRRLGPNPARKPNLARPSLAHELGLAWCGYIPLAPAIAFQSSSLH